MSINDCSEFPLVRSLSSIWPVLSIDSIHLFIPDTALNEDTGKRQIATSSKQPAKVRKLPTVDYALYERERVRLFAFGEDITDADYDEYEELVGHIPAETYEGFRRAFLTRHPLLIDDFEEHFSDSLSEAITKGNLLDGAVDIQDCVLFHPKLPSRFADCQPLVEYRAVEDTVKPGLLRLFGWGVPLTPQVQCDALLDFQNRQPELAKVYMEHLYSVYPELMEKSKLTELKQVEILERLQTRDT